LWAVEAAAFPISARRKKPLKGSGIVGERKRDQQQQLLIIKIEIMLTDLEKKGGKGAIFNIILLSRGRGKEKRPHNLSHSTRQGGKDFVYLSGEPVKRKEKEISPKKKSRGKGAVTFGEGGEGMTFPALFWKKGKGSVYFRKGGKKGRGKTIEEAFCDFGEERRKRFSLLQEKRVGKKRKEGKVKCFVRPWEQKKKKKREGRGCHVPPSPKSRGTPGGQEKGGKGVTRQVP